MKTTTLPSPLLAPPHTAVVAASAIPIAQHLVLDDDRWCLVAAELPAIAAATDWVTESRTGAVVSFSGTVRDHAEGVEGVAAITYTAYDAVALERLRAITARAQQSWAGVGRIALWHRTGVVPLGDTSVVVTVAASHRPEAFLAAQFCIDVLKASVPVWKNERAMVGSGWTSTGVDAESVDSATRAWLADHGIEQL